MDMTFDKVNALPDFLLDNIWELQFSKMPAVSGITSDEIGLRAVSFTPPKKTINYVDFTLHTFKKPQPVSYTPSDTLTITIVETIDAKTLQFIKDWRELCAQSNTNIVSDKDSREAEILCYHKNNQQSSVWTYKIEHVTLQDYSLPDLADGSSPATVTTGLVIKYTDFKDGKTI